MSKLIWKLGHTLSGKLIQMASFYTVRTATLSLRNYSRPSKKKVIITVIYRWLLYVNNYVLIYWLLNVTQLLPYKSGIDRLYCGTP